jgi:general secretion pathway protein J
MKCTAIERGFTLIELLTALLILALLALMSYRSLGAVLDARDHVRAESAKWRAVQEFFARFERDANLASPRPVRDASGSVPPWLGQPDARLDPRLEFTRFAAVDGVDTPRRVGYGLNAGHQIELWIWPGLDLAPTVRPARYAVLDGVSGLDLQYLDGRGVWVSAWPSASGDAPIPRAVRVRVVLASGEQIVRVFALVP